MVVGRLRESLGLPRVAGRWPVLTAAVIDSLGSGLFLPFAVLYFLRTSSLPLATVGVGLSAAAAGVIVLVPVAGLAVDRIGAARCVVAANLLQAGGFVGYLWVDTLWQLVLFALVVAAGRRLFWTGNGAFVALVADPEERTRWFGLIRALRNGGVALGGGLAAAAAAVGTQAAYHLLVVGNAASFGLAALLLANWCRTAVASTPPTHTAPHGDGAQEKRPDGLGYRAVLADHPFLMVVAANFLFLLCGLVVDVLLTVYITGTLHRPAWLSSLLFTLNGVLVVATQTILARHVERRRPTRMLYLAVILWATALVLLWAVAAAPSAAVLPGLLAAVLTLTAAEIVCMPILSTLALALAPSHLQGRYFAVQGLTWILPQAIAPAAFTWLLSQGTAWPWVTLLVACGLNFAVLTRLRRILPAHADRPETTTSA